VLTATENLLEAGWEGRALNDGDLDTVCTQYSDLDGVRLVEQVIALENLKLNSSTGTSNVEALSTRARAQFFSYRQERRQVHAATSGI